MTAPVQLDVPTEVRLGFQPAHPPCHPGSGAPGRTRTDDARLRTAALCPLSYGGPRRCYRVLAAGRAGGPHRRVAEPVATRCRRRPSPRMARPSDLPLHRTESGPPGEIAQCHYHVRCARNELGTALRAATTTLGRWAARPGALLDDRPKSRDANTTGKAQNTGTAGSRGSANGQPLSGAASQIPRTGPRICSGRGRGPGGRWGATARGRGRSSSLPRPRGRTVTSWP